jgi:hypothetical protein
MKITLRRSDVKKMRTLDVPDNDALVVGTGRMVVVRPRDFDKPPYAIADLREMSIEIEASSVDDAR